MRKTQEDIHELSRFFDSNDPFMGGAGSTSRRKSGGHQVVGLRTAARRCPPWMANEKQIMGFLLYKFPKLRTNSRQKAQAGLWAIVIIWCFRYGMTAQSASDYYNEHARELGLKARLTPANVRKITERIQSAREAQEMDDLLP